MLWVKLCEIFITRVQRYIPVWSHLGDVVVSVLATGPKGRGFKPSWYDGFLKAIKMHSTSSFGWEIKSEVLCRKILRHVKDFTTCKRSVDVSKILNMQNSHAFIHSSYLLPMSLLVGLPESSGKSQELFPASINITTASTLTFTQGWTTGQWRPWFWDVSLTPRNQIQVWNAFIFQMQSYNFAYVIRSLMLIYCAYKPLVILQMENFVKYSKSHITTADTTLWFIFYIVH
jgi:hypothetical protein